MDSRTDSGALFENYIISELKKKYHKDNIYFWRTTDQQEIDFILEHSGELTAIEIKERRTAKLPNSFIQTYSPAHIEAINRDNYLQYLTS